MNQGKRMPIEIELAKVPAAAGRDSFEEQIAAAQDWISKPRFDGITRLHTAQQIAEQQGTIHGDYTVARQAADAFYARLRELFNQRKQITTFGPYSPGQAVNIKRMGIEGIYLGGWATSAKGSVTEDPGPDLASYPLSQVPDEASTLVRALLAADKNQHYARARMTEQQRQASPPVDYRPFIIADADTGHGGDAHVRNLIRRFVEVGVPGYHIEDQKPGAKKCGHQGGKVLVAEDEQIRRLNAARLQLDIMRVPGIIVARTDAESATFIESSIDERDHPFILGATNTALPTYRVAYVSILRMLAEQGAEEIKGHLLFGIAETEFRDARRWLERAGLLPSIAKAGESLKGATASEIESILDKLDTRFLEAWMEQAQLKTFSRAVADAMQSRTADGERFEMTVAEWLEFSGGASIYEIREKSAALGLRVVWDCELPRTPEGFYQVQGGIEYAIAKSLAAAPFADILWMETKTADLKDAEHFAHAIHARFPDKMLAYNLSPSFNWDTTGMSDDEMRRFPEEIGKLGFVFNFITYGGHQIDGMVSEEFATALKNDGMLALARLQRKFRLVESPYRTPQTLVGGNRIDGALMAATGRTAATKAMGKGSTQHQHLVQTEVPPRLLEEWLGSWAKQWSHPGKLRVQLRPHTAGSELLELSVFSGSEPEKIANVIFASLQDRRGRNFLSVREYHTQAQYRYKRLTTLMQLFLIHRYSARAVHFVSPTEDNQGHVERMKALGIFADVHTEVGQIIVAGVNQENVAELVKPETAKLLEMIRKNSTA